MPKGKMSLSDQDRLEKLQELGDKLKSAKNAQEPDIEQDTTGWAVGLNYASVFTGAVIVGGAFGYGFDHLVNTKPWGLMVGIILGFAAGTRSIVQMAQSYGEEDLDGNDLGGKDIDGKNFAEEDEAQDGES